MVQVSLWSISPLLAALAAVGTYLRLRGKRRVPGSQPILAMLALVIFWSGCQFVESLMTGLAAKLLAVKLSYVAITLTPVLWALFALGYARRLIRTPPLMLNLLCVVPLVTVALAVTNDWHQLMWRRTELLQANGFTALVTERGPAFYVHATFSYVLAMTSTTILAYVLATTTRQIKPVVGVIVALLVVALANVFYLSPWNPVPWFDCTTLGLTCAALILDATVLRHGVLDNLPVLRDRVLEQLTEGVAVLDSSGRIIDINRAALDALRTARRKAIGSPITHWLPRLPVDGFVGGPDESLEIQVGARCYDVTGSRLEQGDPRSHVVLAFRDVTVRRDAEQALRSAQQELERLANTDSLTGLDNRRVFMERLNAEVARLQRQPAPLSLVIIDLDHFKQINDQHGHAAGDRVLSAVGEQIRQVARATDVAARVGGEEFALLLPATAAEGAAQLAERLRSAIAAIDLEAMIDSPGGRITASIGSASVVTAEQAEQLLATADGALYEAKNRGRNQVCAAA